MKLKSLFCGLFVLAAAVACKQDEPVEEAPKLDVSKSAVTLAAEEGSASFDVTANTAWTASADADWVSVEPATGVASEKAVTVTVTAEDNTAEDARTAKITVKAGELTKTVTVTQSSSAVDVPGTKLSEWALVGSFNSWNAASDVYLSILDENYFVYYGFEMESTTEFKFLKGGVWPDQGGQEIGGNGLVQPNTIQPAGGSNIKATEAGTYDIYLASDLTKFYIMSEGKLPSEAVEPTPVENSWGMMGMFVGNEWSSDVPMTKDGDWLVAKGAEFSQLAFKIRANASWADATNIGVAPGSEKAVVNAKIEVVTAEYSKANLGGDAADIKLNGEAGTYDVYFSFENLEVYVMEPGYKPGEKDPQNPAPVDVTYTVVGTLNNINWSNSAPEGLMTKDGNYHVAKNVPFVTAATLYDGPDQIEFKIVETGTWDGYGVAEGTEPASANTEIALVAGGGNIPVVAAEGNYDVYFDKENAKVWVMTPGYKPGDEVPEQGGEQPEQPEIPSEITEEIVIWTGSHDVAEWAGTDALANGRFDWSKVNAGCKLKVYLTPNNPSADWWCISLRTAAEGWPNITGIPNQYDKPSYSVTLDLTQDLLDQLVAGNGLVITGAQTTLTKVSLLPADAEVVMWEGEMESNGYSNCTIGTFQDWKNNGIAAGDKMRIYLTAGENWVFQITSGNWGEKWYGTAADGSQEGKYGHGFSVHNTTIENGYVEFEVTEEMLDHYATFSWGNLIILQGDQVVFTKISFK